MRVNKADKGTRYRASVKNLLNRLNISTGPCDQYENCSEVGDVGLTKINNTAHLKPTTMRIAMYTHECETHTLDVRNRITILHSCFVKNCNDFISTSGLATCCELKTKIITKRNNQLNISQFDVIRNFKIFSTVWIVFFILFYVNGTHALSPILTLLIWVTFFQLFLYTAKMEQKNVFCFETYKTQ